MGSMKTVNTPLPSVRAKMSEPNSFYLGQLCAVQVLTSHFDGTAYMRLTRDIPYQHQEVV